LLAAEGIWTHEREVVCGVREPGDELAREQFAANLEVDVRQLAAHLARDTGYRSGTSLLSARLDAGEVGSCPARGLSR
jgi:hypothetical protein